MSVPDPVSARPDPVDTLDTLAAPDPGGDPPGVAVCGACGEALRPAARFCEACGTPAGGSGGADGPDGAGPGGPRPVSAAGACTRCDGEVGDDGYCTACGHRALEPVTVDDRGPVASATHRGRRHERNEDAVALAATAEGWPVLVVSDGVSASPNPQLASAAAVRAAAERLAGRPFAGEADVEAAVVAAQEAASGQPADGDPLWEGNGGHPACTIVVAVATDRAVVAGNVGDARVHLLRARDGDWAAVQLTTDDSLAARAVAAGEDPEVALASPGGHTLVAWLGADAPELAVHVATRPVAAGDLVVASSDGLWNYAPTDGAFGALAAGIVPPPPATSGLPAAEAAERLVAWAIGEGGADNVTVALAPVPGDPDADTTPTAPNGPTPTGTPTAPHAPEDEEGT